MFDLEKNTASSTDAPPVRTYRCVACASNFQSLASLLVHQASHAPQYTSPVPPCPRACSRCGTVFANADLLNQHVCPGALSSTATDAPAAVPSTATDPPAALPSTATDPPAAVPSTATDPPAALPSAATDPPSADREQDSKDVAAPLQNKLSPQDNQESDKSHPNNDQPGAISQGLNATLSPKPSTSLPVPTPSSSSPSAATCVTSDPVIKEDRRQDNGNNPPQQSHDHIPSQDQPPEQSTSQSDGEMGCEPQGSCPKCFKTFESHSELLNHTEVGCHAPQPAPKMHPCPHCGSSFLSIYSLKIHSKWCMTSVNCQSDTANATAESSNSVNPSEDLGLQNELPEPNSKVFEEQQQIHSAELDPLRDADMHTNSSSGAMTEECSEISKNSDSHSDGAEVKQTEKAHRRSKPDRKRIVMKILANAYMKVKPPHELKQEQASEDETPATANAPPSPKRQLRPSVRKSYDTNFPLGFLFHDRTPAKKPASLMTKHYCPVVVLETRQKFAGSGKAGAAELNYQCGQCKRLFGHPDKLVLHHALHRKEWLKRCRRCKQFSVRKSSFDVHVCSCMSAAAGHGHVSNGKALASTRKLFPKVEKKTRFQCRLCHNSYTRLYSLKTHKCPGMPRSRKDSHSAVVNEVDMNGSEGASRHHVSVGVGTQRQTWLKKESPTPESVAADNPQTEIIDEDDPSGVGNETRSPPDPVFADSRASTSSNPSDAPIEDELDFDIQTDTIQQVGTDLESFVKREGERGVISPVEDEAEIDVLLESDEDDYGGNDELGQTTMEDDAILTLQQDVIPIGLSDDQVKRFSCDRCHKSFTRNYGLKKHSKICGFGRTAPPRLRDVIAHTILEPPKDFDCAQCNKTFSDIESFAVHQSTCVPNMSMQNKLPDPSLTTAGQESVFVLPPHSSSQSSRHEPPAVDDGRSWGIMSLPSVLPRRVTCECGAGFTCPRLLFEHLQMHAQETYICPHCGENLQSWMTYEAHLRTHAQAQRPPPTEERLQPYPPMYQQPQPYVPHPSNAAGQVAAQSPNSCPKCFKNFKTRCTLLKHMRLICRTGRPEPKMFTCSRCGMSFLSAYTLKLHVQSNTCASSAKAMRCPVCVLSFTSVEGLKKHLITHSQQGGFSCSLCPQTFASANELESHNKSAHVAPQAEQEPPKADGGDGDDSQVNPFKFFRCNACPRVYHSMKSLKDHRRKVHTLLGGSLVSAPVAEDRGGVLLNNPVNFFCCQICPRAYHSLQSLKNHRRRVHRIPADGQLQVPKTLSESPSDVFCCQICQRSYPTLQAWRNHRRRVHRLLGGGPDMQAGDPLRPAPNQAPPGFTCQTCRKTYPSWKSLKEHRRTAHRLLSGLLDPQTGNAADGMQNSHAVMYSCQICHRSYGKLQSLKDHRRKVHHIPGGRLDVIKLE